MYNSLLNFKFISRTKVIAFADEVIVLTRGAFKIETEHYAKQYLKKIERWATDNKIKLNDKKSKGLFMSRERKDDMEVNIDLN